MIISGRDGTVAGNGDGCGGDGDGGGSERVNSE